MTDGIYYVCGCGETRIVAPSGEPVFGSCPECGPLFACGAVYWDQMETTVRWMSQALTMVGADPVPCVACGREPIAVFAGTSRDPIRYHEAHWTNCPLDARRLAPGRDGHPSG